MEWGVWWWRRWEVFYFLGVYSDLVSVWQRMVVVEWRGDERVRVSMLRVDVQ